MEDSSDDDFSFVSASDSEHDESSLKPSQTPSLEVSRARSPTSSLVSLSSFRRRRAPKRPAPLPPVLQTPKIMGGADPDSEGSSSATPMTSFVREFEKASVAKDLGEVSSLHLPERERSVSGFVSHPIHFLSKEDTQVTPSSSITSKGTPSVDADIAAAASTSAERFTQLQLKLIDDVEPLSQPLPLTSSSSPFTASVGTPSSTILTGQPLTTYPTSPLSPTCSFSPTYPTSPLSPTYAPQRTPVYPAQGSMASYLPLSSIYGDLVTSSHQNMDGVASPFYVASIHPRDMVPYPVSSSTIDPSTGLPASPQYVPVAPLTYVPQFSPLSPSASFASPTASPLPRGTAPAPAQAKGMRVIRTPLPLSHSASDPGVNQLFRNGFMLAPPVTRGSLDRLSEAEERDNGSDDDDNEGDDEVFLRRVSDANSDRQMVSVKDPKSGIRRSGSDRFDSVGVPQLYEDLLVSSRLKLKVTFTNLTMVVVGVALLMPNSAAILYSFFRLVFGTLFPAYYSYKAVRTKNVKEYVKWMMYWIVFAFFTCAETITDVFCSFWFPFYYEIKILVVLWLLSPATRGSSILYRKFVHPWLTRKEEEIDECIAKAKQQGYSTVVQLGTKGVNYATSVIMQTAIKGGGGLVNQLKRSYSASEIGEDTADHNRNVKALPTKEGLPNPSAEEDDTMSVSSGSYESEPRHRAESESSTTRPRGHSTGRTVRAGKTRSADVSDVYFHDTTETMPQRRSPRTHDAGRTAEGGSSHQTVTRRSRSGDIYATLPRTTAKRATTKKRQT